MQMHTLASLLSLSKPIMLLVLHLTYINKRMYMQLLVQCVPYICDLYTPNVIP